MGSDFKSFLEPFQEKYDSFETFKGKLPIEYFYQDALPDLKWTIVHFMKILNKDYEDNCEHLHRNPYDIKYFEIKKDKSGLVYMEVVGADDYTTLIIQNNKCNHDDYKNIFGKKIKEGEFSYAFHLHQKERVEKAIEEANIPKRYINTEKELNPAKDLRSQTTAEYVEYLEGKYFDPTDVEFYDSKEEPSGKHRVKTGKISDDYIRKNDIIPIEERKRVLYRFRPEKIIGFKNKNGNDNDILCLIYKKDGKYVAFCEPKSGESWSKVIFIKDEGQDEEQIREYIKAKLEMTRQEQVEDQTIIHSAHTTLAKFKANIAFLLGDKDTANRDDASNSFKSNVNRFHR